MIKMVLSDIFAALLLLFSAMFALVCVLTLLQHLFVSNSCLIVTHNTSYM